jgi:hypothetical protein
MTYGTPVPIDYYNNYTTWKFINTLHRNSLLGMIYIWLLFCSAAMIYYGKAITISHIDEFILCTETYYIWDSKEVVAVWCSCKECWSQTNQIQISVLPLINYKSLDKLQISCALIVLCVEWFTNTHYMHTCAET